MELNHEESVKAFKNLIDSEISKMLLAVHLGGQKIILGGDIGVEEMIDISTQRYQSLALASQRAMEEDFVLYKTSNNKKF